NASVGILQFGASFPWASTRGLAFATSSEGDGGFIDTNGFDQTVTGVVSGSGSMTKIGAGTLRLTTTGTGNCFIGTTTVSAGTMRVIGDLTTSSAVNVTGGTLELASGGGSARVIHTPSVSITGAGKLNIQDNKLITQSAIGSATGGIYSGVTGFIQSGRGTGSWNGSTGIITSQTVATSSNFNSIGVALGSEVKGIASTATAVWAGQTVTGSN